MSKAQNFLTDNAILALGIENNDEVNIVKSRSKVSVANEFVMMFIENFSRLVPLLNKSELRVMLSLLKFLNYNNVYTINQRVIADDTGLSKQAVSKAWSRLKELKILSETDNGIGYINPFIFAKGSLLEVKKHSEKIGNCFEGKKLTSEEINNPF